MFSQQMVLPTPMSPTWNTVGVSPPTESPIDAAMAAGQVMMPFSGTYSPNGTSLILR